MRGRARHDRLIVLVHARRGRSRGIRHPAVGATVPVEARAHSTPEDDGLFLLWHGCVFANRPYGRTLRRWVHEARQEAEAGRARPVVLSLPARTDAAWWYEEIANRAHVYLLRGRFASGAGEVPAPVPSAPCGVGSGWSDRGCPHHRSCRRAVWFAPALARTYLDVIE